MIMNTFATLISLWLSKFGSLTHENTTIVAVLINDDSARGLLILCGTDWLVVANNGDLYACSVDDGGSWVDYASKL